MPVTSVMITAFFLEEVEQNVDSVWPTQYRQTTFTKDTGRFDRHRPTVDSLNGGRGKTPEKILPTA